MMQWVNSWNVWSFALAGLVAMAAWSAPSVASAEHPARLKKFAGNYTFAGSDEQGIATVNKAVEEALAQMNVVKRKVIQKLIGGERRFIKTIAIDLSSNKITIKADELSSESKLGETKTIEGRGGSAKLTVTLKGEALQQVIQSDRGAFTIIYRLKDGGKTLERDVTVTDKWLDKPVKYQLKYKRK